MARRWARRHGPLGGPLQTWAALLPLVSAVERGITSVQQFYADAEPHLLRLAREWAARADSLRALDLDQALTRNWADIAGPGGPAIDLP